MLKRLGLVFYWTGILCAIGWIATIIGIALSSPPAETIPLRDWLMFAGALAIPSALMVLFGWAIWYVLDGGA